MYIKKIRKIRSSSIEIRKIGIIYYYRIFLIFSKIENLGGKDAL